MHLIERTFLRVMKDGMGFTYRWERDCSYIIDTMIAALCLVKRDIFGGCGS